MSKPPCHLLAADIGGTHSRLVLARRENGAIESLLERRYPSRDFADFTALLDGFMEELHTVGLPGPELACLAVAGPVTRNGENTHAPVTNLPWTVDSSELKQRYGFSSVTLLNDFEAAALGIDALTEDDRLVLRAGQPDPDAPQLVLGPGTGLGVALRLQEGQRFFALATEAGHGDFAPASDTLDELVAAMRARHGRVSNELLLSGSGLLRLYRHLCSRENSEPVYDTPEGITHSMDSDSLAGASVDLFTELYGSVTANLVLASGARGGVYLTGSLSLALRSRLQGDRFIAAFNSKPPMTGLLEKIPLYLVTRTDPGLLGTLHHGG